MLPLSALPHRNASTLIEAEAHVRVAGRLVELDPDPDAQREAKLLFLIAQRLRARRVDQAA